MKEYTEYDPITGQIIKSGIYPKDIFDILPNLIEGVYNDTEYYIQNGIVILRPKLILNKFEIKADNIDSIFCAGLPIPFTVYIDNDEYTIDDGIFEFSTDIKGTYKIIPITFPYFKETFMVTAL